ncbi:MAG TPA: hypothetical protein VMZ52_13555 [Bryobacteraceae bacterium]|nr:hypothetical protein [Bryobacteraceae bacterium]
MARRSDSKKARLAEWLAREQPALIDLPRWEQLRAELAPVSEKYLLGILRESGTRLAPLIEGVRQDSFDHLERTLLALAGEYRSGDPTTCRRARNAVIQARTHAGWAVRRDPRRLAEKGEMALWMLTWLENPELFHAWLRLRKRATETLSSPP